MWAIAQALAVLPSICLRCQRFHHSAWKCPFTASVSQVMEGTEKDGVLQKVTKRAAQMRNGGKSMLISYHLPLFHHLFLSYILLQLWLKLRDAGDHCTPCFSQEQPLTRTRSQHAVKKDTVEQRAMCGSVITPLVPSRCRGSTVKEASCVPSSYLICNRLY